MPFPRTARSALCLGVLVSSALGCFSSDDDDERSQAKPKVPELHEIILEDAAPEEPASELFKSGGHHSHQQVLEELAHTAKEPMIKGLFLRLSTLGGSWARSNELRSALADVRKAGKPVHCHFDMIDNVGYALAASSCDRISMGPTGLLMLTGVRAETVYAKDLLDMIGLRAELLQVGRFKGAADALTRSDMPSEVRETLGALVDDLQANLRAAIVQGRKLDDAALQAAIDSAPHAPDAALTLKLIDAVAFDDEARAKAKAAAHAERIARPLNDEKGDKPDLGDLVKLLFDGKPEKVKGKRVSLAYLTGTITDSEDGGDSDSASGPFVKAMRRIADEKDIKAMVLRIDSPGGSALASDKMWHAVRRVAARKPVVVSVGDMAASGGYYVACAGSEIFADDVSLVGSIGVVGGKIVGADLAAKLGVHPTALSRGQNSGWMSPFHPFSPSEREAVQRSMQQTYQTFLSRVLTGRKLKPEQLNAVAEGRIMSGRRAREGGLVDQAGGLQAALARARTQAGLPEDAPIDTWPKQLPWVERASRLFAGAEGHAPGSILGKHELTQLFSQLPGMARSPVVNLWLQGAREPLAALPFAFSVE
ncbi:MAG TPA: signal peptide peptidase SppA [Polyangiales bacterium]|nr:signal peptide peptidase SppA [Polyangiales bacterium]